MQTQDTGWCCFSHCRVERDPRYGVFCPTHGNTVNTSLRHGMWTVLTIGASLQYKQRESWLQLHIPCMAVSRLEMRRPSRTSVVAQQQLGASICHMESARDPSCQEAPAVGNCCSGVKICRAGPSHSNTALSTPRPCCRTSNEWCDGCTLALVWCHTWRAGLERLELLCLPVCTAGAVARRSRPSPRRVC